MVASPPHWRKLRPPWRRPASPPLEGFGTSWKIIRSEFWAARCILASPRPPDSSLLGGNCSSGRSGVKKRLNVQRVMKQPDGPAGFYRLSGCLCTHIRSGLGILLLSSLWTHVSLFKKNNKKRGWAHFPLFISQLQPNILEAPKTLNFSSESARKWQFISISVPIWRFRRLLKGRTSIFLGSNHVWTDFCWRVGVKEHQTVLKWLLRMKYPKATFSWT